MAIERVNQRGEPRATIGFLEENGRPKLRDLWFMWSVCNLECTHCYVESSPRNRTLEAPGLAEIRPFLDEAVDVGLEHIYYTGGEPFLHRDMVDITRASLEVAPTTILTNATQPIEKHLDSLSRLNSNPLTFRVSLDHYEEAGHDRIRGAGTFRRTVDNVKSMVERGLTTIITSTPVVFEENPVTFDETIARYRDLFDGKVDVKLIPFTLQMGAEVARTGEPNRTPFLTESQFRNARLEDYQCHTSRCVQKIGGRMRVYPCPIIYNDEDFDLGSTLAESFQRIPLAHHACYFFCYKAGGKCGDESATPGTI